MPLAPDTQLGRYKIRSLIGAGGMGEVYLAEDTQLHRNVAVKVLPAEFVKSKDRLDRFEREAFAASSLNHPNILTIHEIGESDGCYFIATEHIDGESLRDHLAKGSLELHEVLEIGVQAASALASAHSAGIIHRDVKPENIMVRRDGIVKVLDFGLAKLTEEQHDNRAPGSEAPTRHNTAPGVIMGTAAYMSPEQARGRGVDARTDIWSLGVVLYEMASRQLPFRGDTTADIIGLILHKEPPKLTNFSSQIPGELDRIVAKALAKDNEDRYQLVKDLGIDLKALKRSLEFESARERTESPSTYTNEQFPVTAAISAQFSNSQIHSTSSAEYIANEVKRHKFGIAAAGLVLIAALAGLGYFYLGSAAPTEINSVAVLPFVNAAGDPETEYISDGLSEAIINNLSQLPQLKVISRSSAFKYKGKEIDVAEVAKALGVGAIVMGRVLQRGDDLQISFEMINAADNTQIFGENFTRKAADLQAAESQISRDIAEKLRLRLTGAQEQQLAKRPTQNPEAYQLYLSGMFQSRKGGIEGQKTALEYFTKAVELDPNFARAYASMATTYANLAGNSAIDPTEAKTKSRAAIEKALAIDDNLAGAHNALAGLKTAEWDWEGARKAFLRSIDLAPNSPAVRANYANYVVLFGGTDEAIAQNHKAQELEPLATNIRRQKVSILYYSRRYDEALLQLQELLKWEPDSSFLHAITGYVKLATGRYDQAIASLQKSISIDGENSSDLCYLGAAYARSGRRDEALAVLNKLKTTKDYVSPAELAHIYTALGDHEGAFNSLEAAFTARDLQMKYLKVDPMYDPIRSDPRFADLVRRVGLP